MKKLLLGVLLIISQLSFGQTTETLNYELHGKKYVGFVAKPEKINKKTKTIIIVHEWWGLNEYPKMRAKQLAQKGYIAVCIDMYGNGITVEKPEEAADLATQVYSEITLLNERFTAGYNAALTVKGVNKKRMAAIGYCFGGNVVLNAAKSGANLDAVVSFHGNLRGPKVDKDKLKAAVLICNGADDKFVTKEEINDFKDDMIANNIDFIFKNYNDATHAFTNPSSTKVGKEYSMPIAYNEIADKESYAEFIKFIEKKVK